MLDFAFWCFHATSKGIAVISRRLGPFNVAGAVLLAFVLTSGWPKWALAQDQPSATFDGNTTPAPPKVGAAEPSKESAPLTLGAGDLVEVSVYDVPELNTRSRIGSDGDIYLPLVGYVHIAGLTVDEAQELIEKRFSDGGFVKSPHVTVFVDQYASQGATVLGQVNKPGVYPVLGDVRLFDLISAAGGLADKAGNSVTLTHRAEPHKPIILPISHNIGDHPNSNVRILAGDTIVVRKADIVYVVGDVRNPTGILMERGSLTVLQAIALAGGTTKTSKLNGTKLIHKGPQGMAETAVPLKKILEAKAQDLPMKPDDILFVPSSAVKLALQSTSQVAIQAASLGLVAAR